VAGRRAVQQHVIQGPSLQVPRTHPEIERLEGRYRSQGGLKEGMLVELANADTALVVALGEASVRLDANNMMAGKSRVFELELVALERGQ
jgi:FKBP-type peptidyl-prolyl cis-trans isomerase 2